MAAYFILELHTRMRHLKVFANADAAETWFEENDLEGHWSRRFVPAIGTNIGNIA